jgi:hypothetical protein
MAKLRKASASYLEPGEELLFAVTGRTRPLKAANTAIRAAGQAPGLLSGEDSPRIVLRTNRWIRIMHAHPFSGWKPKEELSRYPLDTPVECDLGPSGAGGVLAIRTHRIYFGPYAVEDAKGVAGEAVPGSGLPS